MEDLFKDAAFDQFLYGGVHDLDRDIGNLVYTIYQKNAALTSWSCSGHVGTYLLDVGRSSRPTTHYVYHPGLLFFSVDDSIHQRAFLHECQEFVAQHAFARLADRGRTYHLILEMDDLIEYSENTTAGLDVLRRIAYDMEVPIAAARDRYAAFVTFWNQFDEIVRTQL